MTSIDEANRVADSLGWGVVLKATSASVGGRPDHAGVYRNIDDPEDMAQAWDDLYELLVALGLGADDALTSATPVVQVMAPPGVALVVTSREDAAFGPIISLGLEGVASQLLGDTVYRVPPLTEASTPSPWCATCGPPRCCSADGQPGRGRRPRRKPAAPGVAAGRPDPATRVGEPDPGPRVGDSLAVLGARVQVAPTGDSRDPLARTL